MSLFESIYIKFEKTNVGVGWGEREEERMVNFSIPVNSRVFDA